ncbi:MAG: phospholipase D family protein [Dehalococcoidia bacterium]
MLNPDDRRLYTDALRPPAGFRFKEALAGTYSLDLETLLAIPLHLALFSAEQPLEELLKDGVALLEALRRTVGQLTVYGQASRLKAPSGPHTLYSLLEPAVIEVAPPVEAGVFHSKLWLIRFDHPDTGSIRLRLLILTRNITGDRCWDLALTLEGEPGGSVQEDNRELHNFLLHLPDLALRPVPRERVEQANSLAEFALRTEWTLPGHFDRVRFHALGLDGTRQWLPASNRRLTVISPFVSSSALEALLRSTSEPPALVSRPEELQRIDPALLKRFGRVMVLSERAELEDGEEGGAAVAWDTPAYGLHAKAYITNRGWDTHLYVGSANATAAALINGINVELVAELIGKRSKVGGAEDLLNGDGFGGLLADFIPSSEEELPDPEMEEAHKRLEAARRSLASAGIGIRYSQGNEGWNAELRPDAPVDLHGIQDVRAWLVTRHADTSRAVPSLADGLAAELEPALIQHVTSFVAFELTSSPKNEKVRFVLNLEAEGMPIEERDAAVVRDVIRNRDGFLRYVMLLLAEAGEGNDVFGAGTGSWGRFGGGSVEDDLPLFEHLTRAFCNGPEGLGAIRRLMEDLGSEADEDVVPPEFHALWQIFEAAVNELGSQEQPQLGAHK